MRKQPSVMGEAKRRNRAMNQAKMARFSAHRWNDLHYSTISKQAASLNKENEI